MSQQRQHPRPNLHTSLKLKKKKRGAADNSYYHKPIKSDPVWSTAKVVSSTEDSKTTRNLRPNESLYLRRTAPLGGPSNSFLLATLAYDNNLDLRQGGDEANDRKCNTFREILLNQLCHLLLNLASDKLQNLRSSLPRKIRITCGSYEEVVSRLNSSCVKNVVLDDLSRAWNSFSDCMALDADDICVTKQSRLHSPSHPKPNRSSLSAPTERTVHRCSETIINVESTPERTGAEGDHLRSIKDSTTAAVMLNRGIYSYILKRVSAKCSAVPKRGSWRHFVALLDTLLHFCAPTSEIPQDILTYLYCSHRGTCLVVYNRSGGSSGGVRPKVISPTWENSYIKCFMYVLYDLNTRIFELLQVCCMKKVEQLLGASTLHAVRPPPHPTPLLIKTGVTRFYQSNLKNPRRPGATPSSSSLSSVASKTGKGHRSLGLAMIGVPFSSQDALFESILKRETSILGSSTVTFVLAEMRCIMDQIYTTKPRRQCITALAEEAPKEPDEPVKSETSNPGDSTLKANRVEEVESTSNIGADSENEPDGLDTLEEVISSAANTMYEDSVAAGKVLLSSLGSAIIGLNDAATNIPILSSALNSRSSGGGGGDLEEIPQLSGETSPMARVISEISFPYAMRLVKKRDMAMNLTAVEAALLADMTYKGVYAVPTWDKTDFSLTMLDLPGVRGTLNSLNALNICVTEDSASRSSSAKLGVCFEEAWREMKHLMLPDEEGFQIPGDSGGSITFDHKKVSRSIDEDGSFGLDFSLEAFNPITGEFAEVPELERICNESIKAHVLDVFLPSGSELLSNKTSTPKRSDTKRKSISSSEEDDDKENTDDDFYNESNSDGHDASDSEEYPPSEPYPTVSSLEIPSESVISLNWPKSVITGLRMPLLYERDLIVEAVGGGGGEPTTKQESSSDTPVEFSSNQSSILKCLLGRDYTDVLLWERSSVFYLDLRSLDVKYHSGSPGVFPIKWAQAFPSMEAKMATSKYPSSQQRQQRQQQQRRQDARRSVMFRMKVPQGYHVTAVSCKRKPYAVDEKRLSDMCRTYGPYDNFRLASSVPHAWMDYGKDDPDPEAYETMLKLIEGERCDTFRWSPRKTPDYSSSVESLGYRGPSSPLPFTFLIREDGSGSGSGDSGTSKFRNSGLIFIILSKDFGPAYGKKRTRSRVTLTDKISTTASFDTMTAERAWRTAFSKECERRYHKSLEFGLTSQ